LRRLILSCLALVVVAAAAAGCSGAGDIFEGGKDNIFTKPLLETPDWVKVSYAKTSAPLAPTGPVAPEDLVDGAGRCAAKAQAAAQAPAQAPALAPEPVPVAAEADAPAPTPGKPSYGSVAGDLSSARMPAGPPPAPMPVAAKPSERLERLQPEGGAGPAVLGGIALGMTECDAVRRAGQPSNVSIGGGDKGARKVVITYLGGAWPGIYTFDSGRLQEIDAAPVQDKPKAAPKKKPKHAAPNTATTERVYVQ
jgi:hypothetical protein